jgi:hypothetical protein
MTTERALPWQAAAKVRYDFTQATLVAAIGAALSEITFSRSGATASRIKADGSLDTAVAANTPRFDFDADTLECRGLLLEEARTNLLEPANPNNTDWTAHTTNGTPDYGVALDGTTSTYRTQSATPHRYEGASVTGGQVYTYSICVKCAASDPLRIYVDGTIGASPSFASAQASFTSPAAAAVVSGLASSARCDEIEPGVYLLQLTFTPLGSGVANCFVYPSSANSQEWFDAQLEAGARASSRIRTTTAAVTRNAEIATDEAVYWLNPQAGGLVVEFESDTNDATFRRLVSLNGGSSSEEIYIGIASGNVRAFVTDDGSAQGLNLGAFTLNTPTRVAITWSAAVGIRGSKDGGAVSGNAAIAGIPTLDRMSFGSVAGGAICNSRLRVVECFDRELSDEELVMLAAGDAPTSVLEDPVIYPAVLYEGAFVNEAGGIEFLRLWSGLGSLEYDGHTWLGQGLLLGISTIEETTDVKAVGFTVSLSGQKSSNISLALNSAQRSRGRSGKVWLALFDSAGAMLDEPLLLKRGKLDRCPIEDEGDKCTLTAHYEDRLIDLKRPRIRRYTDQDQKATNPGDRGFEQVAALQDMQIPWGRK